MIHMCFVPFNFTVGDNCTLYTIHMSETELVRKSCLLQHGLQYLVLKKMFKPYMCSEGKMS